MKIYTKKGDQGKTSLYGAGNFSKNDIRIDAYGVVDELNCVVGLGWGELADEALKTRILEIQKELFVIGAELATPKPSSDMEKGFIQEKHISDLEAQIDLWEKELEPLTQFILPGGHRAAGVFHLARTVCRRAERKVVTLSERDSLRPELVKYLNRLSDWFFVLARVLNKRSSILDILWEGILK